MKRRDQRAFDHGLVLTLQVNNASVQGAAVDDLRDISRERLERTFNTNVIAMFNLVQVCLMSCLLSLGQVMLTQS